MGMAVMLPITSTGTGTGRRLEGLARAAMRMDWMGWSAMITVRSAEALVIQLPSWATQSCGPTSKVVPVPVARCPLSRNGLRGRRWA
jgi:hypothetical protein